jgi:hypothetical protein
MAGMSSRFKNAGYYLPKYQIVVKGKSLFEWSMFSVETFLLNGWVPVFIVKKEDNAKNFIAKEMQKYHSQDYIIIELDNQTDGQATSALFAYTKIDKNQPIAIFNIDTYVKKGIIKPKDIHGDGWIPIFNADGTHWSFVQKDENCQVQRVVEKERISSDATIGFYYFASFNLYNEAYTSYYVKKNNIKLKEKYVAPLYNYLIENNYKVFAKMIPANTVFVLGTPEEVEKFKRI